MNAAQIHLALNHAPLFLSITGGILLASGLIKQNIFLKNIASYFLIAAAISAVPVYLTGESTEELVENISGVNRAIIEEHEEMAKLSFIVIIATGFIALLGFLLRKNKTITRYGNVIALVFSLGSFIAMAQTAHLGGMIRHSEIQTNMATGNDKENKGKEAAGEKADPKQESSETKDDDD